MGELTIPNDACGLKLHRIIGGQIKACEAVMFEGGRDAVLTTLNRAAISGRVEIGGSIEDHFADVLDADGDMVETVALNAASYRILKTKWMRCRVSSPRPQHGGGAA